MYLVCVACRNKLRFDRTNKTVLSTTTVTNNNVPVEPVEKCPVCLDDNHNPVYLVAVIKSVMLVTKIWQNEQKLTRTI